MYRCKYSYCTIYTIHTDYTIDYIWGHGGKHCSCYRPQGLLPLLTTLVLASQSLSSVVCCENMGYAILIHKHLVSSYILTISHYFSCLFMKDLVYFEWYTRSNAGMSRMRERESRCFWLQTGRIEESRHWQRRKSFRKTKEEITKKK